MTLIYHDALGALTTTIQSENATIVLKGEENYGSCGGKEENEIKDLSEKFYQVLVFMELIFRNCF